MIARTYENDGYLSAYRERPENSKGILPICDEQSDYLPSMYPNKIWIVEMSSNVQCPLHKQATLPNSIQIWDGEESNIELY